MPHQYQTHTRRIQWAPRLTPAVKWLIITNAIVFAVEFILVQKAPRAFLEFLHALGLVPFLAVLRGHLWQFFTYMFLHDPGFGHLFWNMLMLFFLGPHLERTFGSRGFLRYYFVTGIGAGVIQCLAAFIAGTSTTPAIGASGALFGLLAAYGVLFPDTVFYLYLLFPIKARTLVLVLAALSLFFGVAGAQGQVAHFAHLGGALVGYLYLKRAWRLRPFFHDLRWKAQRARFRVMDGDRTRKEEDDPFRWH